MKTFYETENVGKAKYLVNYSDGVKTHEDGSPFFDVAIFTNRRKKDAFVKSLIQSGYGERP